MRSGMIWFGFDNEISKIDIFEFQTYFAFLVLISNCKNSDDSQSSSSELYIGKKRI